MADEKIAVRTEAGKVLEVVVLSKTADAIWVVVGEGLHSVKCKLAPTRSGLAYVGSVMGRELVYERSVTQVRADLAKADQQAASLRLRR